jgi:hypothetical protein
MAESPGPGHVVDRVSQVDEQIRLLAARAAKLGLYDSYLGAIRTVLAKLKADTLTWGDPEYHTHQQGGVVCHALHPPLVIYYVVFEVERVVCILSIKPFPGHPLSRDV